MLLAPGRAHAGVPGCAYAAGSCTRAWTIERMRRFPKLCSQGRQVHTSFSLSADRAPLCLPSGVRTKTVKRAARVIIEKYAASARCAHIPSLLRAAAWHFGRQETSAELRRRGRIQQMPVRQGQGRMQQPQPPPSIDAVVTAPRGSVVVAHPFAFGCCCCRRTRWQTKRGEAGFSYPACCWRRCSRCLPCRPPIFRAGTMLA